MPALCRARALLPTVALLAALAAERTPALAQPAGAPAPGPALGHDPDAARLITSDIPRFWAAYDGATLQDAAARFQARYIDAGTPGLRDFLDGRIVNGRFLAATVAARPRFYAAIRANTLAVDTASGVKDAIRASFRRLKALAPDAVFPDVYFVVGRLNSGGTVSDRGLLIGVELNARDDRTPTDELDAWERSVVGRLADLPHVVAHELAHMQRRGGDPENGKATLLARALNEGAADFVAELISGAHLNGAHYVYGDAHERELWAEFSRAMRGTESRGWLYQGGDAKDRPADLGYYEGYKIAQAYYRRAADKRAALRAILDITDPEAFLRASGYAGQAGAPAGRGGR